MTSELPGLRKDTRLVGLLRRDVPTLAMDLLNRAIAAMPESDTLPPDHFVDEVIPPTISAIALILETVEEGRRLSRAEMAAIAEPVLEAHMEDGIPPQTLVRAMGAALSYLWDEARREADAADVDDLGAIGSEILYYFTEASCVIGEYYSDLEGSFESAARAARRALCAALVRGTDGPQEAARIGIPLAQQFLLVSLHVGARHSAERLGDALVARKRMRLVQRHFDQVNRALTLTDFDGVRGVILIPLAADAKPVDQRHLAGDLIDELSESIDGLYGAASAVTVAQIPAAAAECAEVANLAQIVGRPPGLYTIDDVMLEYQLSRPGPARDRLAHQAEPLREQMHLMEALEAHLRHGGDRKSAAAELFVHPNTLTYRLRRIGEVTGINPMTPDGSRLLAAALMVQRLEAI